MEAIRCRSHALAGTENFAPASFRAGPHGDFRIHIGYFAAASSAATGPLEPSFVAAMRGRGPKSMLMSQTSVAVAFLCIV